MVVIMSHYFPFLFCKWYLISVTAFSLMFHRPPIGHYKRLRNNLKIWKYHITMTGNASESPWSSNGYFRFLSPEAKD